MVSFQDEEGVPADSSATKPKPTIEGALSVKSKMYDIDGDGVLDEAEKAMRDMDESGRGFISNEKVYEMMKGHLETQRDLFKLKKVVIALSAFVVLLALSNLGTSLAAAYLAKDTTTNDKDQLVNTNNGQALGTQTTALILDGEAKEALDQALGNGERRLCTYSSKQGGFYQCTATSFEISSSTDIIAACKNANTVKFTRTWKFNSATTTYTLCDRTSVPTVSADGTVATFTNWSITKVRDQAKYLIDGDGFTQNAGMICDMDSDCDSGLTCASNKCAVSLLADGVSCTSHAACATGVCSGLDCFSPPCTGTCGSGTAGGMEMPVGFGGCESMICTSPTSVCSDTFGACVCGNSDCDSNKGEVCFTSCMIADISPGCRTTASLDGECQERYGATATCDTATARCMCSGAECK